LTSKKICNTGECTEGIFALSASGRTAVDELVKTAIGAGRTHALPTTDWIRSPSSVGTTVIWP
jgi:predicted lactoylglutathione lyase